MAIRPPIAGEGETLFPRKRVNFSASGYKVDDAIGYDAVCNTVADRDGRQIIALDKKGFPILCSSRLCVVVPSPSKHVLHKSGWLAIPRGWRHCSCS